MKKACRNLVGILFGICLAVLPCLYAKAEANDLFGIENYDVSEGNLRLYLNFKQDNSVDITSENTRILLDNQELPIEAVREIDIGEEPISYLCLVDVSGSLDENRMEIIRSMLRKIVEQKKESDNVCIRTIGNNLSESEFLGDNAELLALVDEIKVLKEDTNLFYAINECILQLQTDEAVHPIRSLLIFSDGAEDQANGITREEAEKAVRDSNIPVYTVAMLKENASDKAIESAKVLGSFARNSLGGVHYTPLLEGYTYDEVYEKLQNEIRDGVLVDTRLENIELSLAKTVIEVQVTQDSKVLKSDLTVKTSDMQSYIVKKEKTTNEEIIEVPVEMTSEEQSTELLTEEENYIFGFPAVKVYIIGIVVLLVLIVILTIFILKNAKKKKQIQLERETDIDEQEMKEAEIKQNSNTSVPAYPEIKKVADRSGIMVTFVQLGNTEEFSFQVKVTDICKIGRDKQICGYAREQDSSLSGIHCSLLLREGQLFIKDEDSTNGTFVNGVPIKGDFMLSKDDIVAIGSYEYRIFW